MRAQQVIRRKLRHKDPISKHRSGGGGRGVGVGGPLSFGHSHRASGPRRSREASGGSEDGEAEAAASQVQRIFRHRRQQDSRRRAALAIERFYLRRRRAPAEMGRGASSAPEGHQFGALGGGVAAICEERPPSAHPDRSPSSHPFGSASCASMPFGTSPPGYSNSPPRFALPPSTMSASSSPMMLSAGHAPMPPLQPLPEGSIIDGASGDRAPVGAAGRLGNAAALIRSAQLAFRARQMRKKAVRLIEEAWSEWQYHSEQAKLAARDPEHASVHAYHAERREYAARVIQGVWSGGRASRLERVGRRRGWGAGACEARACAASLHARRSLHATRTHAHACSIPRAACCNERTARGACQRRPCDPTPPRSLLRAIAAVSPIHGGPRRPPLALTVVVDTACACTQATCSGNKRCALTSRMTPRHTSAARQMRRAVA